MNEKQNTTVVERLAAVASLRDLSILDSPNFKLAHGSQWEGQVVVSDMWNELSLESRLIAYIFAEEKANLFAEANEY